MQFVVKNYFFPVEQFFNLTFRRGINWVLNIMRIFFNKRYDAFFEEIWPRYYQQGPGIWTIQAEFFFYETFFGWNFKLMVFDIIVG